MHFDEDGSTTWSVAELSSHLTRLLAGAFPDDVWVSGQIRNLNRSNNGHVYFNLAEPSPGDQQPQAQLSVTLLAPEKEQVNKQLVRAGGTVRMTDGIEVRICGRIRWYGPRGTLQLRMHAIDPAFTLGRLQEDRDRLLAELKADGSLERNGRLRLPLLPLRVGLITSRGSAAHADVLSELNSSGIGFEVLFSDARTQGLDSPESVARALKLLGARDLDVILLIRGGGSKTDLASFDSEMIARAIADCPVPVFSGIGHEVDRSIADEVAHSAHKTPTAAARAVVEHVLGFGRAVDSKAQRLHQDVTRVTRLEHQRLEDRSVRTSRSAATALVRAQRSTNEVIAALRRASSLRMNTAQQRLATKEARINAHDPALALARGWSITTTAAGKVLRDPADAPAGTELVTRLSGGTVRSTVTANYTDTTNNPDTKTEEPRNG